MSPMLFLFLYLCAFIHNIEMKTDVAKERGRLGGGEEVRVLNR